MLLRDRLNQALALAECDKSAVVLMFVDLDGFKPVNDAYGHDVGDLLLKAVAKRLRDCVRRSDSVARIGGDEFIPVEAVRVSGQQFMDCE
jgi:diguanylate cyclase (GGDEF)-like protein